MGMLGGSSIDTESIMGYLVRKLWWGLEHISLIFVQKPDIIQSIDYLHTC